MIRSCMPKITLPGGIIVEGDTPDQAAATADAFLARQRIAPAQEARKQKNSSRKAVVKPVFKMQPRSVRGNGFDIAPATVEFLEAIKAAGPNGVPAARVQEILHAGSPKGIGGRMVRMNGYLRSLGFINTEGIFHNPKNRKTGKRAWKPKPQIDSAIEKAREAVAKS